MSSLIEKDVNSTLKTLNGMFSLSFFDKKKSEIIIARDIAGIKPLYYSISNESFLTASQFDQIHEHKIKKNLSSINPSGVEDSFVLDICMHQIQFLRIFFS